MARIFISGSTGEQLAFIEVSLRERPARGSLQVSLEAQGGRLIAKLDRQNHFPRPI
jgi:hypothetical protein